MIWNPHYNHVPKDTVKKIISEGKRQVAQTVLARKYKLSTKTIQKIFIDSSVDLNLSRYNLNWDTNFFKRENKIVAYWSGFLMADGGLDKRNCLEFTQKFSSKNILEKYCEDLKIPKKSINVSFSSYRSKGKRYFFKRVRIIIAKPKFYKDLKKWGIVLRKTYNFVKPTFSNKFMPHYLRGWFDGDGSIVIGKPEKNRIVPNFQFSLAGDKGHLIWYQKQIKKLGLSKKFYLGKKTTGVASYDIKIRSTKIEYLRKFSEILLVRGNTHFEKKWNKYFKYENFDRIPLQIIKKVIKNKRASNSKNCLNSKKVFKEAQKYMKKKSIRYPLTNRRVELEMRNAGLVSKVFTNKGIHFRGWIRG